jgi:hypothetical protein
MYDIEMYIEDLSRLLIEFVTEFYDEERVLRVDKPSEKVPMDKQEFVTYLGKDFADLEFDMEIDVSAQAPISRLRQQNEAEKLINMQGQYRYKPALITPQEYIRISEFTNRDELISRMDNEEMRNKIEEAYQVAQQLQQGMQLGASPDALKQKAMEMFNNFEQNGIGNANTTDPSTAQNIQNQQKGQ